MTFRLPILHKKSIGFTSFQSLLQFFLAFSTLVSIQFHIWKMEYESVSWLIMQFEFFHFSLFVTYSYVYFVTYWSSKAIIYKEQQKRWTKSFWFSVPCPFNLGNPAKKKKPWAFVNVDAALFASAKTCLNKRQSLFWSKYRHHHKNYFSSNDIPLLECDICDNSYQIC